MKNNKTNPLRILAASKMDEYGNDYAYVRSFRRAGHSVATVRPESYVPPWRARKLRMIRRLFSHSIAKEYNTKLLEEAEILKPDLFFAFKGHLVFPETLEKLKKSGIMCFNFYPDVGFDNHGPYLPKSISKYDWVFSTKPEHPDYLKKRFKFSKTTFVPHSFNPEIHRSFPLSEKDTEQYQCDVSFIGNISAGKEHLLHELISNRPDLKIKIWGPYAWSNASRMVARCYGGVPVFGPEYAKAVACSKINLGLLLEFVKSSDSRDVITSRTFHIPASHGFMLHERTDKLLEFFKEGQEIGCFSGPEELLEKIDYYLNNEDERIAVQKAGTQRCEVSNYSVYDRAQMILSKYYELQD